MGFRCIKDYKDASRTQHVTYNLISTTSHIDRVHEFSESTIESCKMLDISSKQTAAIN